MGEFRRAALGTRADLPRMIKAGGLDAQHGYGMSGLGNSAFVAILAGGLGGLMPDTAGNYESQSDGKSIKLKASDAGVDAQVEYEGQFDELQGKLSTSVAYDKCPDAQGRIHVKFASKTSMSKTCSPGGANTAIKAEGDLYYNDDAQWSKNWDMETHIEHAAFDGKGKEAFIDATFQTSTTDAARNTGTLNPTSAPGKRSGVKPSTSFEITAAPRSKLDGTPTGGTVTASLSGGSSLNPANTKVLADAKFTYTATDSETYKLTPTEPCEWRSAAAASQGLVGAPSFLGSAATVQWLQDMLFISRSRPRAVASATHPARR
jgi:hypothetical protein